MESTPPPDDCSVKVAVHIRPLIGDERIQGCQDCVTVVTGKPQVQLFFLLLLPVSLNVKALFFCSV